MKALWAFEPTQLDNERIKGMHRVLTQLAGSQGDVELGYIVTHQELTPAQAAAIPADEKYSVYPRNQIKAALKKAGLIIADSKIHVIDHETTSVTGAVDRFLSLAKSRKAGLVAVFTQARKGYMRYVVGSFAETAVHRADSHLLVLSPQVKVAKRIASLVLATDFGPAMKKHLAAAIELCKKLSAKLTILHHAEIIYAWSLDESSAKIQAYRKSVNGLKAYAEQQCARAGVAAQVIITAEFQGTSDFILDSADKHKANLIVISAKAGPVAALIGGSVSRKVIRSAKVPVLVLK